MGHFIKHYSKDYFFIFIVYTITNFYFPPLLTFTHPQISLKVTIKTTLA